MGLHLLSHHCYVRIKKRKVRREGFGCWQFEFMVCERMAGVRVVCEALEWNIFKVWKKGKKNPCCDRKYGNRNPGHFFLYMKLMDWFSLLKERDVQILCSCPFLV